MEYTISAIKDYDFSSLLNLEIYQGEDGKKGLIIALAEHELYPAVVVEWEDRSITCPFHFNTGNIFLVEDM